MSGGARLVCICRHCLCHQVASNGSCHRTPANCATKVLSLLLVVNLGVHRGLEVTVFGGVGTVAHAGVVLLRLMCDPRCRSNCALRLISTGTHRVRKRPGSANAANARKPLYQRDSQSSNADQLGRSRPPEAEPPQRDDPQVEPVVSRANSEHTGVGDSCRRRRPRWSEMVTFTTVIPATPCDRSTAMGRRRRDEERQRQSEHRFVRMLLLTLQPPSLGRKDRHGVGSRFSVRRKSARSPQQPNTCQRRPTVKPLARSLESRVTAGQRHAGRLQHVVGQPGVMTL
jgi:hypothetical protein